jgi:uncharacterized protein YjiS (DUF1127 family)
MSRHSLSSINWFSRKAEGFGRELRKLPTHILQDIGVEPHLVKKDVAENTFFVTFHA